MDRVSSAVSARSIFVLIISVLLVSLNVPARSENMATKGFHRVKPSPPLTELQQFASWFNQDWKLLFPDFHSGALLYSKNLTQERRKALSNLLRQFLDENANKSEADLKILWLKLGAQGWQANLNIRRALEDFCRMFETHSVT